MTLKVLDLFAGIGGFSLGLERTGGFETVAFCEIDKKAQAVLRKHWPDVPIFEDVKELNGEQLRATGIRPDVITGGFPCQDISLAGRGAGLTGERSGLWWQFHRLIEEIKPSWVIIENVSALRSRGLDEVLWSLSEIGYDAEWHCIPASAVGAPHQRDRIWIVAYPQREGLEGHPWDVREGQGRQENPAGSITPQSLLRRTDASSWWRVEPELGRVVDGVPNRVDRHTQLGNAVVPQIPEVIGRAILDTCRENRHIH